MKALKIFGGLVAVLVLAGVLASLSASGSSARIPTSAGAFNNPGNIRKSPAQFEGEVDNPNSAFTSFATIVYGYRAMMVLLQLYYQSGYTTISEVINHYAPASDGNNTPAYVNAVCVEAGIDPDEDLRAILFSNDICEIVAAMANHEQGNDFTVKMSDVERAYKIL